MRGFIIGTLIPSCVLAVIGCAEAPKTVKELPPPPEQVAVTVPGGGTYKDAEGVRRVAVAFPWEAQSSGRMIGSGFSNAAGQPVAMELASPLDEVVRDTVAAAFKELGFNVTTAPAVKLERPADVKTELERRQSDYLVVTTISQFRVSTSPVPDAPAFGTLALEMQVFGSDGRVVTVLPVSITSGWRATGPKPATDDLRKDVEDLLRQAVSRIVADPQLRATMGLTIPSPTK